MRVIEKDKLFKYIPKPKNDIESDYYCEIADTITDLPEYIIDDEAADVQPISQWISVKDRLPEPEKDVLVWYRYTWGAGFTSYRFGISKWYSNIKRWYEGCLPKDIEVLYWQPLSEPPKQ